MKPIFALNTAGFVIRT